MSDFPIEEVRALFPGVRDQVYLDVCVRGLMPTPVRQAIDGYLDAGMRGGFPKQKLHALVEQARDRFAALIGAAPDEIAIVKNVSEGLNLFAASLPWREGDNVVVCPDLEHPNNVFLWYNLRDRNGIVVRAIEPDVGGRVPVERMAEAIDERTRVVTVPTVSFSPGFITDLDPLAEACADTETRLLVDAAQSIGALTTQVAKQRIDALTVASQKSLMSLYGFGFLYIRKGIADSLVPIHLARYGVDLGDAHETALGPEELTYQPGARRFDLGNYNYLGAVAAEASLEMIDSIGMERIEKHVCGLAARLADGLSGAGLPVTGGSSGPHLAHIVALGKSGGGRHYTADDPAMNELYERLTSNGVVLSIRRGVLRMGLGMYNSVEDVDRVVELV